jgi:hypothetical protein
MNDGKTKMVSPPLEVNLFQTAYDHLLYNISGLRGKNEVLKNHNVIDVVTHIDPI